MRWGVEVDVVVERIAMVAAGYLSFVFIVASTLIHVALSIPCYNATPAGGLAPISLLNTAIKNLTVTLKGGRHTLKFNGIVPGQSIKHGVKLRILGVGDSITVGFPSDGDGNGYRAKLKEDLSS